MLQMAIDTHILEVVVLGLPSAGKSTFIKAISSYVRDSQGWYCGAVTVDEQIHLKFLEPPQLRQFDFIWMRELIEHIDVPGYIVVCDSARPEYFGAVVGILETIHFNHPETPLILVTNKQDDPNAWDAEDIRLGLGVPPSIDVLPCSATRRGDVKQIVIRILNRIFA